MEIFHIIVGVLALLPLAAVACLASFCVLWVINLIFGDNYS